MIPTGASRTRRGASGKTTNSGTRRCTSKFCRCTGARGPTMACEHVKLPGGGSAIVCGARRPHTKCGCGRRATLLCDWKMENPTDHKFARGSTTCDKPLCERCTTSPAPDKDLCPKHAEAFE